MKKNNFAAALSRARSVLGVTQESFDDVSGRVYISEIERGIKHPTLNKIDDLAKVLGVHPLTLCLVAYLDKPDLKSIEKLQQEIGAEALRLIDGTD